MPKARIFPGLDSLVDLADAGVDIRPTLLRVLTDLYVQQPAHSSEEERQYCELAQRLINAVDEATRATVAATLRAYPAAPSEIVERLHRANEGLYEPLTVRGLQPLQPPQEDEADEAVSLSAAFENAGSQERRLILLNLDVAAPEPDEPLRVPSSAIANLEAMALQRRSEDFVRALGSLIGVTDEQARWIVQDAGGEPLLAAAKALGMPSAVMQRVLLFLNPAIGHSVARVYALAQVYEDLRVPAARALVSLWQEAFPRTRRPASPPPVPAPRRGALIAARRSGDLRLGTRLPLRERSGGR